jgi:glutaredoxin
MKTLIESNFLKSFRQQKTFPQIIINGEKIGGFTELEQWMAFNKPDENF